MDSPLHHFAHRAFVLPPHLPVNGQTTGPAYIQRHVSGSGCPQLALHVLQAKQLYNAHAM